MRLAHSLDHLVDAANQRQRDAEAERRLGLHVALPLIKAGSQLFIRLAQQHRLPAIYMYRTYAAEGALMSYGPDVYDMFQRSALYVDRILKGAKPADLPVQQPTKYELVINLKTAKALGLDPPIQLLARTDEVIE